MFFFLLDKLFLLILADLLTKYISYRYFTFRFIVEIMIRQTIYTTLLVLLCLVASNEGRFRRKSYTIGLRFGGPNRLQQMMKHRDNDEPLPEEPTVVVLKPNDVDIDGDEGEIGIETDNDDSSGGKRSDYSVPYMAHLAVIEACAGLGQPCTRGRPSSVLGGRHCCPGMICASKSFSMLSGRAVCQPDGRLTY